MYDARAGSDLASDAKESTRRLAEIKTIYAGDEAPVRAPSGDQDDLPEPIPGYGD